MTGQASPSGAAAGGGRPGWDQVAVAVLAAWLWPVVPGIALMGLARLAGGELALYASLAGAVLTLSPVYSWVGLVIAVPVATVLAFRGQLGLSAALAVGVAAGAAAAWVIGGMGEVGAMAIGAVAMAVFRAVLRRGA